MNTATSQNVVTRIAPSPTGILHVGTLRVAIFNYLFARQHGGRFLVRIEDTDKVRSKREFEPIIFDSLNWIGLSYERTARQSERVAIHRSYLQKLISSNHAYVSKEEEGERRSVIRFRNPGQITSFDDVIRGNVIVDTTDLGDFIIAKDLDTPLHHLAVVVDDADMHVTHVIRGEDLLSNTPRQLLIQEALGFPRPVYAHLPLIVGEDRKKLSKRHSATSVIHYRDLGYLKGTLVNFLALLGWHPEGDEELFSLEQLIESFDLERVQKSSAAWDPLKLDWMNREYLRRLDKEALVDYFKPSFGAEWSRDLIQRLSGVILERVHNKGELDLLVSSGEFDCFRTDPAPLPADLLETTAHIPKIIEILTQLPEPWESELVKVSIWEFATLVGRKDVLAPMRMALSGRPKSPDPFTIAAIIGKEATLRRLQGVLR